MKLPFDPKALVQRMTGHGISFQATASTRPTFAFTPVKDQFARLPDPHCRVALVEILDTCNRERAVTAARTALILLYLRDGLTARQIAQVLPVCEMAVKKVKMRTGFVE